MPDGLQMRSQYLLVSFAFLVSVAATSLAQAQSGGVFQPPEEQRRLGLPDKAAPAPEVPIAPLPPKQRVPKAAPAAPSSAAAPTQSPAVTGQWTTDCETASGGGKMCQAMVRSAIGNQVALVLSIAKVAKEGDVRMQMALPLGFSVQRDVEISIGDFKTSMKVSRCTAQGCLIEEKVSPDFIKALSAQKAGTVRVYTVDGKSIDITLPTDDAGTTLAENFLK
jgi:invasion protein IalB